MAVIKKVASAPVKTAPITRVAPAKAVVKVATTDVVSLHGFTRIGKIAVPPKKAFGKRGIFQELFSSMEVDECIAIPVDADKKLTSKMNSIYNSARKVNDGKGAKVTMRIHEPGDANGLGGTIYLWFGGFYE